MVNTREDVIILSSDLVKALFSIIISSFLAFSSFLSLSLTR